MTVSSSAADPRRPDGGDLRCFGCGLLRYCPICDAYEVSGRKLALAGSRRCRIQEALLLHGYTADLTLITLQHPWKTAGGGALDPRSGWDRDRRGTSESELLLEDAAIAGCTVDGGRHRFDSLYVALGLRAHSDLAVALGAEYDADGALSRNVAVGRPLTSQEAAARRRPRGRCVRSPHVRKARTECAGALALWVRAAEGR
jgi:thioredoxin reductase (NADPH)